MEGIDPYIETLGACHSTDSSVSVPFGRLVAAPTVMLGYVPFNWAGGFGGFGSMEGIDPYIETVGACHSTNRVVSWGFGYVQFNWGLF